VDDLEVKIRIPEGSFVTHRFGNYELFVECQRLLFKAGYLWWEDNSINNSSNNKVLPLSEWQKDIAIGVNGRRMSYSPITWYRKYSSGKIYEYSDIIKRTRMVRNPDINPMEVA